MSGCRRSVLCEHPFLIESVNGIQRARAARRQRPAPCPRSPTFNIISLSKNLGPSDLGDLEHAVLVRQELQALG